VYLLILLSVFTNKPALHTTDISWYNTGTLTSYGEPFCSVKYGVASNFLPAGTVVRFYPPGREPFIEVVDDGGPYAVDSEGNPIYRLKPHPTRGFDLRLRSFKTGIGNPEMGVAHDIPYEVLGRKVRRTMRYNLERYVENGN